MNEEKATSLPKISWYLIARNGDLSSRVREGMTLGEDAGGYLSMIPDEAIVELGIEDGRLLLKVVSDAHEFELADSERARSVRVSPHDAAMISFPNNSLLIDTSFARTNPYSETLTITLVPSGTAESVATDEIAVAAGDSPNVEEIVVPEATAEVIPEAIPEAIPQTAPVSEPLESAPRAEPTDSATDSSRQRVQAAFLHKGSELQTTLPARIGAAGMFVAAAIVSFFFFVYLASDTAQQHTIPAEQMTQSEPVQEVIVEPVTAAVLPAEEIEESIPAEKTVTGTDSISQLDWVPEEQISAIDEELSPLPEGQIDAEISEVVEEEPVSPIAGAERRAAVELLVDVPALFGSEQAPSETTIDFAVRSLQALLIAYPDDDAVVQNLQELTDRLLEEARRNYDLGDVEQAERLMRQASTTGTSESAIADLAAYFETTPSGTLIVISGRRPPDISPTVMIVPRALNQAAPAENVFADLADGFRVPSRGDTASVATADVGSADAESAAVSRPEEGLQRDSYPFAELTAVNVEPPIYPKRALPGTEGVVELEFVVTDTGDVAEILVLGEPSGLFVRAARRAVQDWKFVPVERDGKPISIRTSVRVAFRSGE